MSSGLDESREWRQAREDRDRAPPQRAITVALAVWMSRKFDPVTPLTWALYGLQPSLL